MADAPELVLTREEGELRDLPNHQEIVEIYNTSLNANGARIAQGATRGAFERFAEAKDLPENTPHNLQDLGATRIEDFSAVQGLEQQARPERGVPQVFYKEIPGSDEVLLVTRLNNGTGAEDSTVALAIVQVKDGIPQVKGLEGFKKPAEKASIYTIVSEEQFNTYCKQPTPDKTAQLLTGRLTVADFDKKHVEEEKISLGKMIEQRDENFRQSGEAAASAEKMERVQLIERLEARYIKAMETALTEQAETIQNTEAQLTEVQQTTMTLAEANAKVREGFNMTEYFRKNAKTLSEADLRKVAQAIGFSDEEIDAAITAAKSTTAEPAEDAEDAKLWEEANKAAIAEQQNAPTAKTADNTEEKPAEDAEELAETAKSPGADFTSLEQNFIRTHVKQTGEFTDEELLALTGLKDTPDGRERLRQLKEEIARQRKATTNA